MERASHRYCIAGMQIESECRLPVLAVSKEATERGIDQRVLHISFADYRSHLDKGSASTTLSSNKYYNSDGELWLELLVSKNETIASIPSVASYVYLRDQHQLLICPMPESDPQIVAHYAQALAIPMVGALQGLIVLHASAVVRNDSAVIFVGASGSGKSTAAYLASNKGYQIIADDFVVVSSKAGNPRVWGSTANVRLRPDSLDLVPETDRVQGEDILNKTLIDGGKLPVSGFAISKIVFLDNSQRQRRGQEVFRALLDQLFFGFILSSDSTQAQFEFLAHLVEVVPFVSIDPRQEQWFEQILVP